MKDLFRGLLLSILCLVLSGFVVSCTDHSYVTDPNEREDIVSWFHSTSESSSSSVPSQSSSSSLIPTVSSSSQTLSSSSNLELSSSSQVLPSSSSMIAVSSSAQVSSSSSMSAGMVSSSSTPIPLNTQNCSYDATASLLTCPEKKYGTVVIGQQVWMAENLAFVPDDGVSMCYKNESANCDVYGRLYDWNTAMGNASSSTANPSGIQGVCPNGWHLPSTAEWEALRTVVGSTKTGTALRSTSGWNTSCLYTGTNTFGFNALPSGFYAGYDQGLGTGSRWWTSSLNTNGYVAAYDVSCQNESLSPTGAEKTWFYAVRCVKNPD